MTSELKIAIVKNGDVCAELRSALSGNEPMHSYISEIVTLQSLGQLHVLGYASAPDHYQYKEVYCQTFRKVGTLWSGREYYLGVWRYLAKFEPDVVVVLNPWELLVVPYLWSRLRQRDVVPCLPKPPESESVGLLRRIFVKAVIKPFLRSSGIVLARSNLIKKQMIDWGIDEARISVYLPRYTNEFFECDTMLRKDERHFNLVFLGRLVKLKGVYDLIKIVERVSSRVPNVRLQILGDGAELANMKKQVQATHTTQFVTFVGEIPQKEVYCYLAPADLAVLPSYQEGLGKTALEALLAGVPVLATDGTGFTEFIRHGVNGYLFRAGDIAAFADCICELYHDRDRLARMKVSALETRHYIMSGSMTFSSCVRNYVERNSRA